MQVALPAHVRHQATGPTWPASVIRILPARIVLEDYLEIVWQGLTHDWTEVGHRYKNDCGRKSPVREEVIRYLQAYHGVPIPSSLSVCLVGLCESLVRTSSSMIQERGE